MTPAPVQRRGFPGGSSLNGRAGCGGSQPIGPGGLSTCCAPDNKWPPGQNEPTPAAESALGADPKTDFSFRMPRPRDAFTTVLGYVLRHTDPSIAMYETQVIVVGAGPIGLELAVALQDARIDYLQFEARQFGHTMSWYPRQARFFSSPDRIAICGVPLITADQSKATREEYLAYLAGVAQQFDLNINTYERVDAIKVEVPDTPRRFVVRTNRGDGPQAYAADQVVMAIGDMHRPRRLVRSDGGEIPGADADHVSHYFVEPHPYVGRELLIVGGQNSAVEAAIRCHRAGARVSISYRRRALPERIKYWLKPEIDWLIEKGKVRFYPNTLPSEIGPTHVQLTATADDGQPCGDGRPQQRVRADHVLALIGYEMDGSLLADAGVELIGDSRTPQFDSETMQTNVPGLFVAGTAAAGTQLRYKLFIENCHTHVERILRALGAAKPVHLNPIGGDELRQRSEE